MAGTRQSALAACKPLFKLLSKSPYVTLLVTLSTQGQWSPSSHMKEMVPSKTSHTSCVLLAVGVKVGAKMMPNFQAKKKLLQTSHAHVEDLLKCRLQRAEVPSPYVYVFCS